MAGPTAPTKLAFLARLGVLFLLGPLALTLAWQCGLALRGPTIGVGLCALSSAIAAVLTLRTLGGSLRAGFTTFGINAVVRTLSLLATALLTSSAAGNVSHALAFFLGLYLLMRGNEVWLIWRATPSNAVATPPPVDPLMTDPLPEHQT
ncbi:MAG: hypothetical protein LBM75_10635 [Myxococcales bacterium]|jgi:hypothetical protein|nr:hypothetical protein [Myxococcales bacterium]